MNSCELCSFWFHYYSFFCVKMVVDAEMNEIVCVSVCVVWHIKCIPEKKLCDGLPSLFMHLHRCWLSLGLSIIPSLFKPSNSQSNSFYLHYSDVCIVCVPYVRSMFNDAGKRAGRKRIEKKRQTVTKIKPSKNDRMEGDRESGIEREWKIIHYSIQYLAPWCLNQLKISTCNFYLGMLPAHST